MAEAVESIEDVNRQLCDLRKLKEEKEEGGDEGRRRKIPPRQMDSLPPQLIIPISLVSGHLFRWTMLTGRFED